MPKYFVLEHEGINCKQYKHKTSLHKTFMEATTLKWKANNSVDFTLPPPGTSILFTRHSLVFGQ